MKRRWTRKQAVGVMTTVMGISAGHSPPVAAEEFTMSASIFFEVTFSKTGNAGLGLDLRGTAHTDVGWRTNVPPDAVRSGAGGYAQVVWCLRGASPRVSVGVHGAFQQGRGRGIWDFELGWLYQATSGFEPGGHGLQVGAIGADGNMEAGLRLSIFNSNQGWVPQGHVHGGLRLPGLFGASLILGGGESIPGRPQHDADGVCLGRIFMRRTRLTRRPTAVVARRAAVGARWAVAARAEAASIPTFVGLAQDLRLAGAPDALILRALTAAQDEVRHAVSSAKIASRYLGQEVAVEIPPVRAGDADGDRTTLLTRLAVESWQDGCLNEGTEAAVADARAAKTRDNCVKRTLKNIAREEATHAALAWDVLRWATETGGDPIRDAVADAVAESGVARLPRAANNPKGAGQPSGAARAQIAEAVRAAATDRWRAEAI